MQTYRTPPAVVVGLDSLQGLQVCRILRAREIPTIGVAKDPKYHSSRTRSCDQIVYSDTSNTILVDTLLSVGRALAAKAVLYPCQDTNVLTLSRFRETLSPYFHLVLPDHEVVEQLTDKGEFYALAQEVGLTVPRTYVMRSDEEVKKVASLDVFPLILKPSNRDFGWNRLTKDKAVWVDSGNRLRDLYEYFHPLTSTLLAQEWIEGDDSDLYTCNVYFSKRGELLASFVSRKLRQYPPQLGQGCLAEGVTDPEVAETTRSFFESVGLRGFGYLEFKRERGSGRLVAIEPNVGRPTGRSALAEASGVELHVAMYNDVLDLQQPAGLTTQTDGIKWLHLLRDLQSAFHYLRHGDLTIGDWWNSIRGDKVHAILSHRDPLPFLYSLNRIFEVATTEKARRIPTRLGSSNGGSSSV